MTTYSDTPSPSAALAAAVGPATPAAKVPNATVAAATVTITPYETLIRHNADGTIKGAHHIFIQTISDGNGTVHKQVSAPQALNVADGQHGLNLSAIMSNAQKDALVQITAANDTISKLKMERHRKAAAAAPPVAPSKGNPS